MGTQIITALGSALIGSIIGGLIAIYAAIRAVNRTEYYRLRAVLKTAFQDVIMNLSKSEEHPATLVENPRIDTLVDDILPIMPLCKRKTFKSKWEEYRYDKKEEYTKKSPDYDQKLITERIHKLTSKL